MPGYQRTQDGRERRVAVALLVIGGLITSATASIWIGPPTEELPGIALGSESLLVVERSAAFFAIWLGALIVVANALGGRLPSEISGRGVRYADVPTSQELAEEADTVLKGVRAEVARQRDELAELQEAVFDKQIG